MNSVHFILLSFSLNRAAFIFLLCLGFLESCSPPIQPPKQMRCVSSHPYTDTHCSKSLDLPCLHSSASSYRAPRRVWGLSFDGILNRRHYSLVFLCYHPENIIFWQPNLQIRLTEPFPIPKVGFPILKSHFINSPAPRVE